VKKHNIQEAKTHLSRLVEQALAGEEVVIARSGRPCIKLVPFTVKGKPRKLGAWAGRVRIADDFDAPCPELEALFAGEAGERRP
jgi:prevent-host-death family protein